MIPAVDVFVLFVCFFICSFQVPSTGFHLLHQEMLWMNVCTACDDPGQTAASIPIIPAFRTQKKGGWCEFQPSEGLQSEALSPRAKIKNI